jgi:hypothetical protein
MVVRPRVFVVVVVLVVAAAAAAAAVLAWPRPTLAPSATALASVSLPGFAGRVQSVHVTGPGGKPVPVVLRRGAVWPQAALEQGQRLTVTVEVTRPGWIGWLAGRRVTRTLSLATPTARLGTSLVSPRRGAPVVLRYAQPVARVRIGSGRLRRLPTPATSVPLGLRASGATSAGTALVAAAPRSWELLGAPVRVSWFVRGTQPLSQLAASPAVGSRLSPATELTLSFSRPVSQALGSKLPRLEPSTPGRWTQLDEHTLAFRPGTLGFPLGATLHVTLPRPALVAGQARRVLDWRVPEGSQLRLQQLLAQLGYLPLRWHASSPVAQTPAAELAAAVSPPAGAFAWKYAEVPDSLRALWQPGRPNEVVRGAVMMFEDEHGLTTDGIAGPQVWRALLRDELAGHRHTAGYSYVYVHRNLPQSLNLWHAGRVILTSPGNTGVAQAPTPLGTWPVFEHIPVGTMSGTNPDGSHYNDPGIKWISYFHGGDALHAFPRASYGTPQSLGCVELPESAAQQVWPYTPIGTLVTIEP